MFPLFATGVNDTGGKFAAGVVDTGGNLPPVSLTPAANLPPASLTPVANLPPVSATQGKMVAKFATGVVDTGGKFVAGVVDTGGNLPPVSPVELFSLWSSLLHGARCRVTCELKVKKGTCAYVFSVYPAVCIAGRIPVFETHASFNCMQVQITF